MDWQQKALQNGSLLTKMGFADKQGLILAEKGDLDNEKSEDPSMKIRQERLPYHQMLAGR
jgi:hypothetical protein